MEMDKVAGVILAGGRAQRLGGGDKVLLSLAGRTLLSRIAEIVAPQVQGLALNAVDPAARFSPWDHPVINDGAFAGYGPLAGVLAALRFGAEAGVDWVLTVPGDTPFLPGDLVARLSAEAARGGRPIVLAGSGEGGAQDGLHPTVGLWSVRQAADLEAALRDGTRTMLAWCDAQGFGSVRWPNTPRDPFFNVNTQEDLAEAERLVLRGD
ncbi:MAG: molybdenum cofactor guanylyltransferase MobA [Pseudomonadota bacterium]